MNYITKYVNIQCTIRLHFYFVVTVTITYTKNKGLPARVNFITAKIII